MARFRFNRNFNVNRVVKRLIRTILALYVGGTIMTVFGSVMTNTSSPFYQGLSLIGWTVGNQITNGTTNIQYACSGGGVQALANTAAPYTPASTVTNCITSTSGSGVLAVVGIIAIAQIVTEFVTW